MKGEIWVEKDDFWGDLFFLGVWTLFGDQPPHPPTFGRDLPEKRFFYSFPYCHYSHLNSFAVQSLVSRSKDSLLFRLQILDEDNKLVNLLGVHWDAAKSLKCLDPITKIGSY